MSEISYLLPPTSEKDRIPVDSLNFLRSARMEQAQKFVDGQFTRELRKLDKITNISSGIERIQDTYSGWDIGNPGPNDLMAFDALGMPAEELASLTGNKSGPQDEVITTLSAGGENLRLTRYANGVSLRFNKIGHTPDFEKPLVPVVITEKIRERYSASPAFKAAHELADSASDTTDTVKSEDFDPFTDPLGTLAFLHAMDIVDYNSPIRRLREGDSRQEILHTVLNEMPPYSSVTRVDEDGVITWHGGTNIRNIVEFNTTTRTMNFSLQKEPYTAYPEVANQAPEVYEIPFIETETAKEMYRLLDDAGLMLNPVYEAEIIRIGEAERYGSVYTAMSREVAKWINRPERVRVSEIFVPFDPAAREILSNEQYSGQALYEYKSKIQEIAPAELARRETLISEKLLTISTENLSEPTRVLFGMVREVLDRPKEDVPTELPVTKESIDIRDGACFDVTTYYIGSAAYFGKSNSSPKLQNIKVNGIPMLEKAHGSHTFMLEAPVIFNGVNLPKGTLMQRGKDDGWAMLRLTPFCFDDPADRQATGSEMAKTIANEQEAIFKLGGTSLSHLIYYAA